MARDFSREIGLQRDATMSQRRGRIIVGQRARNGAHTVASVLFRRSKVGYSQVKQSPDCATALDSKGLAGLATQSMAVLNFSILRK